MATHPKHGTTKPTSFRDIRPDVFQFTPDDKPFVAWDGEGITYPGDVVQSYVLFGASTGARVTGHSLTTLQCLNLLLQVEATNRNAIHVGFAFQYDVNMILKDLSRYHVEQLYRTGRTMWAGYKLSYMPGKWFGVSKPGKTKYSVRVFDVWSFFQSSFVVACERYLGSDHPRLRGIREGKDARKTFAYDQLEEFIIPYWRSELILLVKVMCSMRADLESAGLRLNSWHGPGAVANTTLASFNVKTAIAESPMEVRRASQYAYAGGRFELFRCGHHPHSVHQYDINSAYPSAISRLPNLQRGDWERVSEFEPGSFGVWRIDYDSDVVGAALFTRPQPAFYRDSHGRVSFPPRVKTWLWTPEAELVKESVEYGYVFRHDGSLPFDFVGEMYATRQAWKREGNSAERALKLALNSLYGKMAQRVGWTQQNQVIPRWHNLEWAGYVTSSTRAKLWEAMQLAGDSLIAVETDAVFSTEPLPLDCGKGLGQWEATEYDYITYLQSGMYFASHNGTAVEKYRGFDRGSLPYASVVDSLSRQGIAQSSSEPLHGRTTRFIGFGVALHTSAPWRSWQTTQRAVLIGGGGKRAHRRFACAACQRGIGYMEGLHDLAITTAGGESQPHSLPWINENSPAIREMEELERW